MHVLQQEECGCLGAAAWRIISAGFLSLSLSLLSSVITPPFISSFPSKHNHCHSIVDFFWSQNVATETAPTCPRFPSPVTHQHITAGKQQYCANVSARTNRGRAYKFGFAPARGEAAMSQGADGRSWLPRNFAERCTFRRGAASFIPVQTCL